ncbi:hypothetical protein CSOJ01_15058, partial [Colletotrichum sojae]
IRSCCASQRRKIEPGPGKLKSCLRAVLEKHIGSLMEVHSIQIGQSTPTPKPACRDFSIASDWKSQCFEDPGDLQLNPDIGVIGVLIGFVGTAWFSVLLVVLHFLFVFDLSENPYEIGDSDGSPNPGRTPNYVDVLALKLLRARWFRRRSRSRGKRSAILIQAFYDRGCENAKADYRDWLQDRGDEPVLDLPCTGHHLSETWAFGTVIVSILIAGFSFPSRVIQLVGRWSVGANTVARNVFRNPTHSLTRISMAKERVFVAFLAVQVYLVAKIYADLLSSELSDVYWVIISAIWGTIRLQQLRSFHVATTKESELEWQFGQILPVFLLSGPVILAASSMLPGIGSRRAPTSEYQEERGRTIAGQSTLTTS